MKLGIVTDSMPNMSFEEVLITCNELGLEQIELGCGNWSSAPHVDLDYLLEKESRREEMKNLLEKYNISISALNCSGNPLAPGEWGKREDEVTKKTFRLAQYLGIDTIIMMSGLPAAGPNDEYPNWIVTSWPIETQQILTYQWNEVAIPYWRGLVEFAKKHGIRKIALEPHGCQLVHDVENFRKLKEAVGDKIIGFNLDPSHLLWMGADPISVARALEGDIYHVHIKDVRVEKPAEVNTLLDGKPVLEFSKRSWNFVIPGYGHDERWWREFIVTLKMIGYDGALSIEHEDYTMETSLGIKRTISLLNNIKC